MKWFKVNSPHALGGIWQMANEFRILLLF